MAVDVDDPKMKTSYAVPMGKTYVTLGLDEELVGFLQAMQGQSMSRVVNDVLWDAFEGEAHRRALSRWLDELDRRYGTPSQEAYARADALLDQLMGLRDGDGTDAE